MSGMCRATHDWRASRGFGLVFMVYWADSPVRWIVLVRSVAHTPSHCALGRVCLGVSRGHSCLWHLGVRMGKVATRVSTPPARCAWISRGRHMGLVLDRGFDLDVRLPPVMATTGMTRSFASLRSRLWWKLNHRLRRLRAGRPPPRVVGSGLVVHIACGDRRQDAAAPLENARARACAGASIGGGMGTRRVQ